MSSFSLSGGVEVMGYISPTDTNDTYPVIDPLYGIDGFRNVNLITDLNSIPEPRRRAGMVVGISGGTTYYKLKTSPWNYTISDWSLFNTGGGGDYLPLSGGTVTGSTTFTSGLFSNTISATTYQNLPIDVRVTGGTYSNGTSTFTNNTGGTFNVTGFYTGTTDVFVTGGTYSNGSTTFTNNTGGTFNVNGFYTGSTDVFVTGGTYSDGTTTFTNNTGGTFNVNGFYTGSTDNNQYVTGFTYNDNNIFTISDNSGNTFNATINTMTGLTVSGIMSATTISGGTFYGNGLELTSVRNLVTVGLSGTNCDYSSIKSAVNSITDASATNTYVVIVGPGVFYEDTITMKSYVDVVGESATNTIIQANNPNLPLIVGADQSMVNNVQVQGCTGTGVAAVIYSSSTTPQLNAIFYVENVRFGANYTHVKNIGTGGGNSIIQCSNVKYGGYPFTLGFYCTNDGSGIGRMQLRNVTSTNGGVTTTTGLIFAKADKPGCGFIVNGCLLTKAVGSAAGTGFWVEDGGFLRLTGVNFQRWVTGIYAPQTGSAPSIDAIALNFENCTTDVEIIHSGATGKIQGTDSFLKTKININAPLYEVNTDPRQITVAKKGADFTSIKSAVDYLISSGNTSSTNRYVITVGPGVFIENEIDLTQTPYVSLVGSNIQTTQILPNTNSQHIIKIGINNEVSFLSLSGAPSGYAGIYCYDIGDYGQAHKVSFYDCDTNIWVESNTQDTKFFGEYLDYNGDYEYGTKVIGNNGYLALANMENYFNFPTGAGVTYCNYATGSGATISVFVGDNQSNGVSGSTAFYIQDGAELYSSTITADGFTYGIRNPNVGLPIRFDVDNASFINGEWDLYVERNGTFGTFGGSSSHEKLYSISSDVYWAFLDIDDGEFDITRKVSVTFADGTHTDFTTLIFEGATMGLMEGGDITIVSGFTVNTASGFGYLAKTLTPQVIMRIDWLNSQITLGANENKYIYINENSILSSSGARPSSVNNIILGRVITNSTGVSFIDLSPVHSDHTSNRYGSLLRNAMGPIYAQGSVVTENVTPFKLDVTTGEYYYSSNDYTPSGGTGVTFTQYIRNGSSGWVTSATTDVSVGYDNNTGTLSPLPLSAYTKHTLYVVGDGLYEKYFLVLGQNYYTTLVQAEGALLPTPPTFFTDSVSQIANIYIQQGTTGITQVEDIRPVIGFKAGGVNASSVHGNLLGLGADDHTQYLLVNGGRSMAGDLSLGGNNITTVGTVNGVTVETHATRHKFGGSDPVGSTTPGPNYIPYADVSGTLDSWVSTATTTTLGRVKLSTSPVSASNPIVIGDNDIRVARSLTGGTYSNNTFTYTNNTGGTFNVLFNTVTGLTVNGNTIISSGLTANTISASTISAPGSTTQVIYNNGGILSANTGFTYNNINKISLGQSGTTITGNGEVALVRFTTGTEIGGIRTEQTGSGVEIGGVGYYDKIMTTNGAGIRFWTYVSGVSNTERMRITNGTGTTWGVGINTTTPSATLHVEGTTLLQSISGTSLDISGNSSSDLVKITQTGSGNAFVVEDSIRPDSSPFVIDNSGNVGIGTTTPSGQLQVGNYVSSQNGIQINQGVINLSRFGQIQLSSIYGNYYGLIIKGNTANVLSLYSGIGGNDSNRFSGGVVGTTINDGASIRNVLDNGTGGAIFMDNVAIGLSGTTAKLHINNTTSGNTFLAEDSSNPDSSPFVIDASGNTGIGTSSPSEKLDVSGKTKTINLQVTSGATTGYVLTSDVSGNATWQIPTTFTGGTVNELTATTISATTISGGTLYGNGSNLTGLNIYNLTGGTDGQIISKDSSSDYDYTWKYDNEVIQLQIISEGNTISNGFKGYRYIDKDLTLHKITMLSNSAATVDFRVAYSGGTIGTTGLSGQSYNVDTTLSGWVTNLSGGTFIEFYVDTAGTINTTQGVVILTIDCYKKI